MELKSSNSKFKLKLRALKNEDAEALAFLANNKNIWNNIRNVMPYPYALEDAHFFINLTSKEAPQATFAIEVDGEFCGIVGLVLQSDVYRLCAELGYWVGEPYWGKGIVTEAVKLITDYGLHELGLERIFASVFAFNIGSMRVLEKNGFEKEGIARRNVIKNGKIWDSHMFAIVKG